MRKALIALLLAAMLVFATGFSSIWTWVDHPWDEGPAVAREQVNPDGTCDLVDANGVPLLDSQFSERTGSDPCAQQ